MNKFEQTVSVVSDIAGGYRRGLGALSGAYSKYVGAADNRMIDGSVDIDNCTKNKYPSANRWDYVISYSGKAYYLEVHPATEGTVKEMEAKLKWLKDWLKSKAIALDEYPSGKPRFTWVHSGKCGLSKTSSEFKKAAMLGLILSNGLKLK